MGGFWEDRSPRERMLLGGGGLVILILALYQFVLAPFHSYKDRVQRSYETAIADLRVVENGAAEIVAIREQGAMNARAGSVTVRQVVSASAARYGIAISRLSPAEEGVALRVDSVDASVLFRWIRQLEQGEGVQVSRASISRNDGNETVRADLTLTQGLTG